MKEVYIPFRTDTAINMKLVRIAEARALETGKRPNRSAVIHEALEYYFEHNEAIRQFIAGWQASMRGGVE